MTPLHLTHTGIVSALGQGSAETLSALREQRSGLRPCDFADIRHGAIGRVDGVENHALLQPLRAFDCRNNRLADMALRSDGFVDAVDAARARYGAERIAVVVGTSTSGILSSEEAYRHRDAATGALPEYFDYDHTHDLFSLARFVRAALGLSGPAMTVSTACASSARSIIDASHLIETGLCDAAVVGGADSLCRMTLRGFASLDLISPGPCRPCDASRSGISIGEAAGFALLEKADTRTIRTEPAVALLGAGASSDGYHMSSPHPEGAGAASAMRQALGAAGLEPGAIDYVNLHGTGTRANDSAEDKAVFSVFGDRVPCSSTKGWTGHAMGSCGIVEAVICILSIRHSLIPGCFGVTDLDPSFRAWTLSRPMEGPVRRVLSNSLGFGGVNCSLILGATA